MLETRFDLLDYAYGLGATPPTLACLPVVCTACSSNSVKPLVVAMNGEASSSSKELDDGTLHSDQEALVDVPLSFELSGFETLPNVNRGTNDVLYFFSLAHTRFGCCCCCSPNLSKLGLLQEARLGPPRSGIMQLSTLSLLWSALAYLACRIRSVTWAGSLVFLRLLQLLQYLSTLPICWQPCMKSQTEPGTIATLIWAEQSWVRTWLPPWC